MTYKVSRYRPVCFRYAVDGCEGCWMEDHLCDGRDIEPIPEWERKLMAGEVEL